MQHFERPVDKADNYYNPASSEKAHPALVPHSDIDMAKVIKETRFDISAYLSTRYMRRLIEKAKKLSESKTPYVTMVLIEIYRCNPRDVFCKVSQARIAERCHMGNSTVQRIVSGLRRAGVLHVIHNYRDTKRGRRRTASTMIFIPLRNWLAKLASEIGVLRHKSLHLSKVSQLSFIQKTPSNLTIVDTSTGEIMADSYLERLRSAEAIPVQGG